MKIELKSTGIYEKIDNGRRYVVFTDVVDRSEDSEAREVILYSDPSGLVLFCMEKSEFYKKFEEVAKDES